VDLGLRTASSEHGASRLDLPKGLAAVTLRPRLGCRARAAAARVLPAPAPVGVTLGAPASDNHIVVTPRPRVVVVGAGFGGLAAVRGLAGAPVDVTVVDQDNYHGFWPLLYQVASSELAPEDIAAPIRAMMSGRSA